MTNELFTLLNNIAEDIILLNEGDLEGLTDYSGFLKNHVDELKTLEGDNSKGLTEALLTLIKACIRNQVLDFQQFIDYFSRGISIYQRLHYNLENQLTNDDIGDDGLIVDINKLLFEPEDETEPEPEQVKFMLPKGALDNIELYNSFTEEALEYIDNIEKDLLNLEATQGQTELIQSVFRSFHTIKGISGFLNLDTINYLAHHIESFLEKIIEDKLSMDSEEMDVLLEYTDLTRQMVNGVVDELAGKTPGIIAFDQKKIAQKIQSLLDKEKNAAPKIGDIMVEKGIIDKATLDKAVEKQKLDKDKKIGQILIEEKHVLATEIEEALKNQQDAATQLVENRKKNLKELASIRVNSYHFDNLLDTVGEVVIANNQIMQNPVIIDAIEDNDKLENDFKQLYRSISELQKTTMAMRMVEIRQTFQKMNRLTRDLSKKSSKPVDLIIEGNETEIDRRIVDEIYEPLVHIIRNAIDHGIENTEQRLESGKNETAAIFLRAYHQGGNVVIEVEDDGSGIDRKKVLAKAIDKGLIDANAQLSQDEIDNLIFLPGFSTSAEVTEVSGRGVGMDVVDKKVRVLKGKIDVVSINGRGSRFIMKLPLTMAIIDGMVTVIGDNQYVIPTIHVIYIFRIQKEDYFTYEKKNEMIKIRGKIYPLIRLYSLLNEKAKFDDPGKALLILVEEENQQKCLMVDDIIDKQEIVVKTLGDRLKNTPGIAASTILGNGNPGLILDIKGIFQLYEDPAKLKHVISIRKNPNHS